MTEEKTEEEKEQDEKFSRRMVVVAHADDAEYGCSATVAKWCDGGWEVVCGIGTEGREGRRGRGEIRAR